MGFKHGSQNSFFSLYVLFSVCSFLCLFFSLYVLFSVCSFLCLLFSLYVLFSVFSFLCMFFSLYVLFSVFSFLFVFLFQLPANSRTKCNMQHKHFGIWILETRQVMFCFKWTGYHYKVKMLNVIYASTVTCKVYWIDPIVN